MCESCAQSRPVYSVKCSLRTTIQFDLLPSFLNCSRVSSDGDGDLQSDLFISSLFFKLIKSNYQAVLHAVRRFNARGLYKIFIVIFSEGILVTLVVSVL